jgi:hypothetical protein
MPDPAPQWCRYEPRPVQPAARKRDLALGWTVVGTVVVVILVLLILAGYFVVRLIEAIGHAVKAVLWGWRK